MMYVLFERPAQPTEDSVTVDLPHPPRVGDWVSLGDDLDEQYLVRTVIWHVGAPAGQLVQVILKG